ncbi:MAG: hypothetical protein IPP42_22970 [Saprospiraceae bacterium]|nr:hypothetical protein [Saprospiraceae bacterium]
MFYRRRPSQYVCSHAGTIKHGYSRTMWAEHPHILDYDRDYPGSRISGGVAGGGGGGGYAAECFNAGFCRAMMWAVLSNG